MLLDQPRVALAVLVPLPAVAEAGHMLIHYG
jgi:hypothetical protein